MDLIMEEKIVRVTGKGAIHVIPDVTRLSVRLVSLHDTYQEAYEQAKQNTDVLCGIMNEVKLDIHLPKTIRLDITKETTNKYDKNHNYIGENFLGFQLVHVVKLDLGMDNVLLNKIVKSIGLKLKQAEIDIGYTVRDNRPFMLKALERAVKDAKEKAELMALAAGCKLGACKQIDYSEHEIHVYTQARTIHDAAEACCCNEESLEIAPEDLEASDSVNVIWYLE